MAEIDEELCWKVRMKKKKEKVRQKRKTMRVFKRQRNKKEIYEKWRKGNV